MTVTNPGAGASSGPTGLLWTPSSVADLHQLLVANATRITVVNDPLSQQSTQVFKVECDNADVFPLTPTTNPRAQMLSMPLYWGGADLWAHFKFLFPVGFPAFVAGKFFQLAQVFGAPAEGNPTWELKVGPEEGKERTYWQRNGTYGFDIPWEGINEPITRGEWIDVYVRHVWANQLAGGLIEMWYRSKQIEFFKAGTSFNPGGHEATKQLVMSTEDAGNNEGPNDLYLGQYRALNTAGMLGTTTMYFTPPKIGFTKAAVA